MNKIKEILLKNKLILLIVFMLIQCITISLPIIKYTNILLTGDSYQIEVTGYDPYDVLRGRYLTYILSDNHFKLKDNYIEEEIYHKKDLYLILDTKKGIDYVTFIKPNTSNYITLKPDEYNLYEDDVDGLAVTIQPSFNNYYINQKNADIIDKEFRNGNTTSYITIVVKDGKYVVKNMIINNNIV